MKKFILKIFILVLLSLSAFLCLALFNYVIVGSQYGVTYQASLLDKVDRLESINEPKIILVGNSNLAFGIHSEMIEEEIGMPVVNLGLHGGLGNAFHEQIAKLNINKGDIVVLCHRFTDENEITDTNLAWVTLDNHKELFPIYTVDNFKTIIFAYPAYIRKSTYLWLTGNGNTYAGGEFSRYSFNEYGDIVERPESEQMDVNEYFSHKELSVPSIQNVDADRINKLNAYCNERGASLVVAGWPIAYGEYSTFTRKDFKKFNSELSSVLDCDVISNYTDYFYPYDYFYNTSLHLTDAGATARTLQLIQDLKKWLNDDES